jgi:F-type H+-transporting ATPase subunit gamma
VIEEPTYVEAMQLAKELLKNYMDGEIGEIYLAYTYFKNTVVHEPKLLKLLPVSLEDEQEINGEAADTTDDKAMMNFEPEADEALSLIIPKYVASLIYGALIEAVASENGARMQAMDSATSNAEEMIGKLSLQYNRARQGSITQELTEIIAGAEAIS